MKVYTYDLQDGWFSITLPDDWEEYDDDNEGTFCFFNSQKWTGNLRITPFHWPNSISHDNNKAAQYIAEEIKENEGAVKIYLKGLDCAFYKKCIDQEGEELAIYYWITGQNNDIFICSFTINKNMEQNSDELDLVQGIIKSII